jgi:peptide/nickel transport system substrate-binding protein
MRFAVARIRVPGMMLLLAALLLSCGPADRASAPPAAAQLGAPPSAAPRQIKTLKIGVYLEPTLILTGVGLRTSLIREYLHRSLALYDDHNNIVPQLAVELPTRANGTWVVRPDGTMQTTYRIRPNLTWHDGTPLTARDFAFAWRVTNDPELPIETRSASRQIASIATPDDHTLVIEWKTLYALANALVEDDLGPFPSHLLQAMYEADKQQMWNSPWWTREFMGVGPYKLVEWESGSHIEMEAFDGYFAGRPKIDRVSMPIITSPEALLAQMLAGTLDLSIAGRALGSEQMTYLKQEYERQGLKPTLEITVSSPRLVWVQHRVPSIPELRDVRVRRALVHALDRQALTDAMTEGRGPVADTFIPPSDIRWEWAQNDVTRYPYDPTRAEALFAEAGMRRGPDRVFVNGAGTRVALEQWANAGPGNEREVAITSNMWKAFGVETIPVYLPPALQQDRRHRVGFPALHHVSLPDQRVNDLEERFLSSSCPSEANGYSGQNFGCYASPAADRIMGELKSAFEPADQRPLWTGLMKLQSEELPFFSLFWQAALAVSPPWVVPGQSRGAWNMHEWDLVRS